MKRLALPFLYVSSMVVKVTSQANTYTVGFHNPGNPGEGAMTPIIISDNTATQIECSGDCNSIPPHGDALYRISSNDSSIPWGTFTAIFTYTESSDTCDSGIQQTKMTYNEVSVSGLSPPDTSFTINVGEGLPSGLTGDTSIISRCAIYK